MTARERLNRRKWRGGVVVLAGVVIIFAGVAVALAIDGVAVVVALLPGLAVTVGGALATQQPPVRCPGCAGNLSAHLMRGSMWRVDPKLRYCPYCAASLDADTDAPSADPEAGPDPDAPDW